MLRFDAAALIAGRACRDALGRLCRWHVARGLTGIDCALPDRGEPQ